MPVLDEFRSGISFPASTFVLTQHPYNTLDYGRRQSWQNLLPHSLAVYSTCRQKYGRTSVDSQLMKLRLSAHGFCETYKTVAPYERGVQ